VNLKKSANLPFAGPERKVEPVARDLQVGHARERAKK
jgi:hypothetical protein